MICKSQFINIDSIAIDPDKINNAAIFPVVVGRGGESFPPKQLPLIESSV